MLKDITFGQYFPQNSIVHKLDPRIKIVLLVAFIVFIFLAENPIALGLIAVASLVLIMLTKVPLSMYLKNIKGILFVIILTSFLNLFYVKTGTVLLDFWIITITTDGLIRALFMSVRIIVLILSSSILTYTTTPTELTDAIERLLKPLSYIGLGEAVHIMAMMITIALRFIPTLIEETDKIMSAQKARGADLESGSLLQRIMALIPILIPLLISSVRRAYDLADAMECRCYSGGAGRQRMKQLKLRSTDYISCLVFSLFFVGVILLNIYF